MSDLRELYQEVILDHNRRPRNFHQLEGANRTAEGYNPLCGDQITVSLRLEDDVIQDISFQGSGCAISKASASLMTDQRQRARHRPKRKSFSIGSIPCSPESETQQSIPRSWANSRSFQACASFPHG